MLAEALIAAASSFGLFLVFSTQAASRIGRHDWLPRIVRRLFVPTPPSGRRHSRVIGAIAAIVIAGLAQTPVLAVAAYRGSSLETSSAILLGVEVVAAAIWAFLLIRWTARRPPNPP